MNYTPGHPDGPPHPLHGRLLAASYVETYFQGPRSGTVVKGTVALVEDFGTGEPLVVTDAVEEVVPVPAWPSSEVEQ